MARSLMKTSKAERLLNRKVMVMKKKAPVVGFGFHDGNRLERCKVIRPSVYYSSLYAMR